MGCFETVLKNMSLSNYLNKDLVSIIRQYVSKCIHTIQLQHVHTEYKQLFQTDSDSVTTSVETGQQINWRHLNRYGGLSIALTNFADGRFIDHMYMPHYAFSVLGTFGINDHFSVSNLHFVPCGSWLPVP